MLVNDVICPFCGSLCDDLVIDVEEDEVKSVDNSCKLGYSKIMGYAHNRIEKCLMREGREPREISYDEAIDKTAKILLNAKRPLIYGLSSTTCEAIEKSIELAIEIGALIDQTSTVCHGPTVLGVQEEGKPSCTLGEVKNRADLIIYWGCNPFHAHPRHMERYSLFTKGYFVNKGRKDRKMVVVDVRESDTSNVADIFLRIEPESDYKILNALISIIMGNRDLPEKIGGISKDRLEHLSGEMVNTNFGMIFFGMGVTQTGVKDKNIESLSRLVKELNGHTKFSLMPMRGHYNVAGASNVFTWQTGFPYSVDFSRGYAYYNPGETTANDVLARGEVDAMLVVASDPAAHFVNPSVKRMAEISLIVIEPHFSATTELADLIIPTAISGIEAEGTAYRMDEIPIRMKKIVSSKFKSDLDVLNDITNRVRLYKKKNMM